MIPSSSAARYSGQPLLSVPLLALDTETTGLDVSTARIVEIGAVRIAGGEITAHDTFRQLVNPQLPIPAAATAVHGITDADVSRAPPFPCAIKRFNEWAGSPVVIGCSIGFDLAVLRAEYSRAGLPWQAPRSLDALHLVRLLAPELPDYSVETAAAWLQLRVGDRHRAVGDATTAALLLLALAPRLREAGLNTLAQVERATFRLAGRLGEETRAGWHDPAATRPAAAETGRHTHIDSYPYRHRLRDLMRAPPEFVPATATLEQALGVMTDKQISSVFLPPEDPQGETGILTERDVLRAIRQHRSAALQRPAATFASRGLHTLGHDEYVYRALTTLSAKKIRHLGVVGDDGELVGALSARDLLGQRAAGVITLGENIAGARSAEQLGRVWSELSAVTRVLLDEQVDARDIAGIVSRELRALTARACQIAESLMMAAGHGPPPVRYTMLVLGSGGRGESLLAMDQDNAIVYARGGTGGEDRWLARLAGHVADILDRAGVCYCKGGVMARNSAWRMDVDGWRRTIEGWITRSRPEDILNADIFFDGVAVHGACSPAEELRRAAIAAAADSPGFLKLLSLNAADFHVPLGWFGRFALDRRRVDLKLGGILPIVSCARVLALKHRLYQRGTVARLQTARQRMADAGDRIYTLVEAHRILIATVLKQQLRDLDDGIALSNRVDPAALDAVERQQLHWALRQIAAIHDLLSVPDLYR